MTEIEFGSLLFGRKVWVIDSLYSQRIFEGQIVFVDDQTKSLRVDKGTRTFYINEVFLTELEALESVVEKTQEMCDYELKVYDDWCDRLREAKERLAKARRKDKWIADTANDTVYSTPLEYYDKYYATAGEAWKALSDHHLRRYYETADMALKNKNKES